MKPSQHILVLRLSAMGDVAMMVPLFRSLFKKYPTLRLTLVSRPLFKPIFREFDRLDFFAVDLNDRHKGQLGLWRLYQDLKALNPTAVADLHSVLRTHVIDFFFKTSGYQVAQIDKGRPEKKALTRANSKVFVQLKTTLERYADVFRKLGFEITIKPEKLEPFDLSGSLTAKLPAHDLPWIGIAPFASYPGKTYPLALMQEVVKYLASAHKVLLFGAPGEEAATLDQWAKDFKNVSSMSDLGSFENELQVISNLDLMISMDSANGHLAANFGIPVLTVWGLTHPYAGFAPFSQNNQHNITLSHKDFPLIPTSIYGNKIPAGYDQAMQAIKPESIVEKALGILS